MLCPGAAVRICGLASDAFADLNGCEATICGWEAKSQRWKVRVGTRSKALALHPQNLAPLSSSGENMPPCETVGGQGEEEAQRAEQELWEAGFEAEDVKPLPAPPPKQIVIDRAVIPSAPLEAAFDGDALASLTALGVQAYDAATYDEGVIEQAQAQLGGRPNKDTLRQRAPSPAREQSSLPDHGGRGKQPWRIPMRAGSSKVSKGVRDEASCSAAEAQTPTAWKGEVGRGEGKEVRGGDERSGGENMSWGVSVEAKWGDAIKLNASDKNPKGVKIEGADGEMSVNNDPEEEGEIVEELSASDAAGSRGASDEALARALSSQRSERVSVARKRIAYEAEVSDSDGDPEYVGSASEESSDESSQGEEEEQEEGEKGFGQHMSSSSGRRVRSGSRGRKRKLRNPRSRRITAAEMNPYTSSDDEAQDEQLCEEVRMPGRLWKRLFPHQRVCVEWLLALHQEGVGGIVGDEMGLGKTLQMIALFLALNTSEKSGPCLVVAPATVIRQWQREFQRWAPEISPVLLLHGSEVSEVANSRLAALRAVCDTAPGACSVLVTTYEMVRSNAASLLAERWQYVVLDEGHKIRNPDAEVTLVCKSFNTVHRIILTGAPIQNKLSELWSLFDFVFPGKLGTLPAFQEQFALPISAGAYANASNFKVQAGYQCSLVLRDMIRPYLLRRLKADVELNLPNKSEQVLFCQLTDEQRDTYEEFVQSDLVHKVLAKGANAFAALTTVLKICNHPHLYTWDREDQNFEGVHYGDWKLSGKMRVLQQVLHMWKQRGDRVLLFCQTKQMLDIVQAFVRTRYAFRRLDGTTAVSARLRLIDEFNGNDSIFIFLLTTRAGGLGINLTGANRVVLIDPDWNPANDSQARERAYRVGQKRDVTIFRLVTAGTLEEKVYQRQIFKQFLSNNVLRDPKLSRRVFKPNDLRDLLAPPAATGGLEGTQTGDLFARAEKLPSNSPAQRADPHREVDAGSRRGQTGATPAAAAHGKGEGETGFLQQLLDGELVGSALNHDMVCDQDGSGRSGEPGITTMEARRLAERAAEALRQSQESRGRETVGLPTWTGRNGSAGLPSHRRFGGALNSRLHGAGRSGTKSSSTSVSTAERGSFFSRGQAEKAPVGSAALLKRIEERKVQESGHSRDREEESRQLMGKLCDFFRQQEGRCCTSQQLSARFKNQPLDAILFRQLLRTVANKNDAGLWVLSDEFINTHL